MRGVIANTKGCAHVQVRHEVGSVRSGRRVCPRSEMSSQAKTAPMRAARKPAEPKPAALLRAPPTLPPAPEELVELGEVLVERTEVGEEMELGGFVVEDVLVVEVLVRVELTRLVLLKDPEEEEPEARLEEELEETGQLVVEPGWTEKGADCEEAPVVSRSNNPRLVPEATGTTQVNEVPVRPSQE